ncbi:hypothetical protein BGW80DRAFT_1334354 [Lactifluus volemus]|nr:hypothetical protein BGW80DRAFT_1334354 [Lactifluus volemus]
MHSTSASWPFLYLLLYADRTAVFKFSHRVTLPCYLLAGIFQVCDPNGSQPEKPVSLRVTPLASKAVGNASIALGATSV